MEYPEHLLPQPSYRIISFDSKESMNLYLVRRTSTTDIKDEYGRLKSEHVTLQSDHLKDYSTNLLGLFKPSDCLIAVPLRDSPQKRYFQNLWAKDEVILTPIYETDFAVESGRGCFFLRTADFHQKQFSSPTSDCVAAPTCEVLHTPTNANFWHCSIRWFCDGEDSGKWKEKKFKRMKSIIRAFVIQFAEFDLPDYEHLDSKFYS